MRSGRFNPSSLLIRRNAVLSRVGYFDRVRKAADSEYIGRIQAAFGVRRVRHLDSLPLALIRLSAGSLSRSEIKPHWMHPARTAYSSAYLRYHQQILAGVAAAARPADGSDRPFAAPGHLLGADPEQVAEYDVLMVADWRFLESAQRTALDEIGALRAAGMRVALLHLESPRGVYLKRQPLSAPVQDLINQGRSTGSRPASWSTPRWCWCGRRRCCSSRRPAAGSPGGGWSWWPTGRRSAATAPIIAMRRRPAPRRHGGSSGQTPSGFRRMPGCGFPCVRKKV
ncbi:hypothetical protein [Paractinoplanes durhamensis]|uniref:hypothetical protein n=1 Tax=Paractinoplanes durhamensis TaxID=113563 RepID=UPI00363E92CA